MLHVIKTQDDPLMKFIKDDPVRPEIPAEWRVSQNREILTLVDEHKNPLAMVCVAFCDTIPSSVEELLIESTNPHVAIFYTIWSYAPGAGATLLQQAASWLKSEYSELKGIVTLSPQTPTARRFHLKNGAKIRKENPTSVNYEYYFKE